MTDRIQGSPGNQPTGPINPPQPNKEYGHIIFAADGAFQSTRLTQDHAPQRMGEHKFARWESGKANVGRLALPPTIPREYGVIPAMAASPFHGTAPLKSRQTQAVEDILTRTLEKFQKRTREQVAEKGMARRSTLSHFASSIASLENEIGKLPLNEQGRARENLRLCRVALAQTLVDQFPRSGEVHSSLLARYIISLKTIIDTAGIRDERLKFSLAVLEEDLQKANAKEFESFKLQTMRDSKEIHAPIIKLLKREQSVNKPKPKDSIRYFDSKILPTLKNMDALKASRILQMFLLQTRISPELRDHIEGKVLEIMDIRYKSIFTKRLRDLKQNPSPARKANAEEQLGVLERYADSLHLSSRAKQKLKGLLEKHSTAVRVQFGLKSRG